MAIRNEQAAAKLRLAQLKVDEQQRRLLPVAFVQSLLGDALSQLRQKMLTIPLRLKFHFRTIDASLTQQIHDWLRDDINEALIRASEIQPALVSEDPWATWYRDNVDKDEDIAKAVRTKKRHAKARR